MPLSLRPLLSGDLEEEDEYKEQYEEDLEDLEDEEETAPCPTYPLPCPPDTFHNPSSFPITAVTNVVN